MSVFLEGKSQIERLIIYFLWKINEPLINSRQLTKHRYVSEFCLYIIFCVSNYQWSQTLKGGCNKKHRVVQCDIIKCCIVNHMATVSVSMVVYCAGSFLGSNSCCPVWMCLLKRKRKKKVQEIFILLQQDIIRWLLQTAKDWFTI